MSKDTHETKYTTQVRVLLDKVYIRNTFNDSVLDRAISFFKEQADIRQKLDAQQQELTELQSKLVTASGDKKKSLQAQLTKLEHIRDSFGQELRSEREIRQEHFDMICREVIDLAEGNTFSESNRKSSQLLGTIQLLSPTENSNKRAITNEQHKPIYKAILTLRLLDRLCIDKYIQDPYIKHYLGSRVGDKYLKFREENEEAYQQFVDYVKVPLVMAALLQDIGNFHPDARLILEGANEDKDPFRTLELDERKELLQIDYRETLRYLAEGIGAANYIGNSKADRDKFKKAEQKKLIFIKSLLKSCINPKDGVGNLLKIPQIYASIVLSTKSNYNYKLLPKVFQVLNQNAERGACSQIVVDSFYKIVGMFPQGYGVTYLPLEGDGSTSDRYEYAIVNNLYPANPENPNCRTATRQLAYIGYGSDISIKKEHNMYFAESAKKLANISKERLMEILESLSSNYHERAELDLIPRCWHPKDYFSLKANQKLWVREH